MDPDAGRFMREEEAKAWMTRFEIGETVKVKEEEFEILAIKERELILKPLSAGERQHRDLRDLLGAVDEMTAPAPRAQEKGTG